jgi:hypothetical protein
MAYFEVDDDKNHLFGIRKLNFFSCLILEMGIVILKFMYSMLMECAAEIHEKVLCKCVHAHP